MEKSRTNRAIMAIAAILLAVAVFNLSTVLGMSSKLSEIASKNAAAQKLLSEQAKEQARAANISITEITAGGCLDCYNLTSAITSLKSANVNVLSEKSLDYKSEEAKALISKYNISKIPTFIIAGEINKSNIASVLSIFGEKKAGAIVFNKQAPIYLDLFSGNAVGNVSAIVIDDAKCAECRKMDNMLFVLKSNNVVISSNKTYDRGSEEAKNLIKKYNITMVPSLILSPDLKAYEQIAASWAFIGSNETDGSYVLRAPMPPYVEISTGKIRGLVNATYITDKSCADCYDVAVHKRALQNYGLLPVSEKTYDISSDEGKALLSKYNITKVPTVVLSPETAVYAGIKEIWASVGNISQDGTYIFTAAGQMGAYKDLATNKTVKKTN